MSGVTIDKLHTPKFFSDLGAAEKAAAQMATGEENPTGVVREGQFYVDILDGWKYAVTSTGVNFGYHVAVYDETETFLGYL